MAVPKTIMEINVEIDELNDFSWGVDYWYATPIIDNDNIISLQITNPLYKINVGIDISCILSTNKGKNLVNTDNFLASLVEYNVPKINFHATPLLKLTKISEPAQNFFKTHEKLQDPMKLIIKPKFPVIFEVTPDEDILLINSQSEERLLSPKKLLIASKITDDLQIKPLGESSIQSEFVDLFI